MKSRSALQFVLIIGIANFFADFTYEGARGIVGPFLGSLGERGDRRVCRRPWRAHGLWAALCRGISQTNRIGIGRSPSWDTPSICSRFLPSHLQRDGRLPPLW